MINEGNRDLEEIELLERAKIEMEYKRIEVEKFKAWGTVISISIQRDAHENMRFISY